MLFTRGTPAFEKQVRLLGSEILRRSQDAASSLSSNDLYGQMMRWSMSDPAFKSDLFRLVDVLPSLKKSRDIVGHLKEYLGGPESKLPGFFKVALKLSKWIPWPAAWVVRRSVEVMANQFITGHSIAAALKVIGPLEKTGFLWSFDFLGETVVSEKEAEAFSKTYLDAIKEVGIWCVAHPLQNATHSDYRANISLKISAFYSQIRPESPDAAISHLKERLRPIVRLAATHGVCLNFDMEHHALKRVTLDLFMSLFDEPEFIHFSGAGLAIQAYLTESHHDLEEIITWAKNRSARSSQSGARSKPCPITVRLVKGAYWDYENVVAAQKSWPSPVFQDKPSTDAHFEKCAQLLLEAFPYIRPAFATHNVRSMAACLAMADERKIARTDIEFQMLYGMAEPFRHALMGMEIPVRLYCPVGELIPGMAYFVRRLLENTSNESFLKASLIDHESVEDLLWDPVTLIKTPRVSKPPVFKNAPYIDFTVPSNRLAMDSALTNLRSQLPLLVGRPTEHNGITSYNPAEPNEVIGHVETSDITDVSQKLKKALSAQLSWEKVPAIERSNIIRRVGDLIERDRFSIAALQILEVGKTRPEADADVCEAIDFCRYYACQMEELAQGCVTQKILGENNSLSWKARGTGVVIAPWNFPLAILCGMTVAGLVTGNAVLIKPSGQSVITAHRFVSLLYEAGVPRDLAPLVCGSGAVIGNYLVEHNMIRFISFTGSQEVGLGLWEKAAKIRPGQDELKKVICEMGGKNAVIIDADADLDEAVAGCLYSAFGYQGQKCSALSRLIVLESVYNAFVDRFVEAAASLPIGPPEMAGTVIGPVIDGKAQSRILKIIESGKGECDLIWQGAVPDRGYYVPPTLFGNTPRKSAIAQEEIFGPVVCLFKVRTLQEALAVANDSVYALTGGIYSRSPASINNAKAEFNVGNLYINRPITGAVVERHPFGGFKLSGSGTKAGGKEYLTHFMVSRVVSENVLRRGYVSND
ncbi:MAG: proline dehydrogenase family protein [Verrucomicrobiota bacterium]|nr:proline dehydrogenase family protein [Verrucomicrobiota bacterium]